MRASAWAGIVFGCLALISQALALAAPPMGAPRNAGEASRELSALIGSNIVVCTQSDSGAPVTPTRCDDRCPLCQAAAGAFAFVAPTQAPHFAPAPLLLGALSFPPTARAPPSRPAIAAFARGPPSLI